MGYSPWDHKESKIEQLTLEIFELKFLSCEKSCKLVDHVVIFI